VVDFGRVTVGSTSTQHLLFVNSLDQPLHVVLDLSNIPELKGSKSTAQVGRGRLYCQHEEAEVEGKQH
jgi:hypothetical protein